MRVTLVGLGSVGDVAPLVSVGRALRAHGHQVSLVALAEYADLAAAAGVRLAPIPGDTTSAMWPANRLLRRAALAQPGVMYATMRRRLAASAADTVQALLRAATDPQHGDAEVIVPGLVTAGAARLLAARTGARVWPLLFAPLLPAADPAASCLASAHVGRRGAWASSTVLWRLTQAMGRAHTQAMAERLGSPDPHPDSPHPEGTPPDSGLLLATSPILSPPNPQWSGRVQQVGWIRSSVSRPPLPEPLTDFLAGGEPPVLMTFGSCPVVDPKRDLELFLATARRVGVRAVVQSGAAPPGPLAPGVFNVGSVDHQHLLPRVAAVVHHGGAGTTYSTLAAGRPAVVIPHLGDQGYYGRRVQALGAGPAPIPRWRLTAPGLTQALRSALESDAESVARTVAAGLTREDGAEAVARVVVGGG